MQLPDFEAAHLPAPRRRSADPSWLGGCARGQPAYLCGGAGGLLESPGIQRARNRIVLGSNWTLRALAPSLWQVVDRGVWQSERGLVGQCDPRMVVVANKGIFGGGAYSVAGGKMARELGKPVRTLAEISVRARRKGKKVGPLQYRAGCEPAYMPEKITDQYHPGGNSVCYLIQTAHLMGCDPIYLLGFTMESGTPYHFGRINPVTKRGAFWDVVPPMDWLRWYESRYPARVMVCSGWSGPIYDVFKLERFHESEAIDRHESEAHGGDVSGVQQSGQGSDASAGDDQARSQSGLPRQEETPVWWGQEA